MKTVEVSESALESLKAMVRQLQSERDELLLALQCVLPAIDGDNECSGQAEIARELIAKCTQTQSICDWQEKIPR